MPDEPGVPAAAGAAPGAVRRSRAERWAMAGITIEFMALVRTLSEVFRLRAVGGAFDLAGALPYVTGALIAAVFCWASVTLFFLRRYRTAALLSAALVAVLLAYKFVWMR